MTGQDSLRIFKPLSHSRIYLSIIHKQTHTHAHHPTTVCLYMLNILATKMYTTKRKRKFRSLATVHTYCIRLWHLQQQRCTIVYFNRNKCYDLTRGGDGREQRVNEENGGYDKPNTYII